MPESAHLNFGETTTRFLVPIFTGKTRITGKTAEILERPKNYRETLISALRQLLLINEYNKKYMLFIICYIYNIYLIVHFDIMNFLYRKWTLQNKTLKSLFQSYNLTYF